MGKMGMGTEMEMQIIDKNAKAYMTLEKGAVAGVFLSISGCWTGYSFVRRVGGPDFGGLLG